MQTRVRAVREDDLESLVDDLWLPYAASVAEHDPGREPSPDARERVLARHRDLVEEPGATSLVAVPTGSGFGGGRFGAGGYGGADPVGFATARRDDQPLGFAGPPRAVLEALYVLPSLRRQGVGRALLDAVTKWAGEVGCGDVVASVPEGDEDARACLLACGFGTRELTFGRASGDSGAP
jgi:GNAT superfamily N-acetyltransferase